MLLHEAGHLAALFFFNVPIEQIRLKPFGIEIQQKTTIISYRTQRIIYISGPLANTILAVICAGKWNMLSAINTAMLVFHLLPIVPLDGGNILQCTLQEHLEPKISAIIEFAISVLFLTPLTFWSLYLWSCDKNPTLLITCLYLCMKVVFQRLL